MGLSPPNNPSQLPESNPKINECCNCNPLESKEDVFCTGYLYVPVYINIYKCMPRFESKYRIIFYALIQN